MSVAVRNNYANILNDNHIMYMPSCIVVEMMTRLYSQVSTVNLTGSMLTVVPDLLVMLRRLGANLRTTAEAYHQKRIRYFIGDWREDKLRARRLFFNIMSRLGYITELLTPIEKKVIYEAVEKLAKDWNSLDLVMENRAANKGARSASCGACLRFRSADPNNWRQIMADRLLLLHREEKRDSGTRLILLCYNKVKNLLTSAVDSEERIEALSEALSPDDIVVISDDDVAITCPLCSIMSDSLREGKSEIIHRHYRGGESRGRDKKRSASVRHNPVRTTRRHVMPPSLVGVGTRGKAR